MAAKTLAYSNRGGFWKTRYSFMASCYGFIDRCLVSSPLSFLSDAIWKHDDNDDRCTFYDNTYTSGLSVTFNENPSVNKVYKAFSLESTNNVAGTNSFLVNNSSSVSQIKTGTAGPLQEKGGIMYGHIGQSQTPNGTSINLVGQLTRVDNDESASLVLNQSVNDAVYRLVFAEGGKSNLSNNGIGSTTKFFIYNNDPLSDVPYFTVNSTSPVDISLGYGALPSDLTLAFPSIATSNTEPGIIHLRVDFTSAAENSEGLTAEDMFTTWVGETATNGEDIYSSGQYLLFSVTPENVNGDDLKGQTADATVLLGNQPYELYALNLEYSPTDLDHSK
jgi:hypothetical protein